MSESSFTDRDLRRRIFPGILRDAGLQVEAHVDHFDPDALDAVWVPAAAARGWIILSNDQAIMRRPLEREAVRTSGATLLVLIGGNAPAEQIARNFVNTLPKVEEFLLQHSSPLIAKIYRPTPVALVADGRPGRIELKVKW